MRPPDPCRTIWRRLRPFGRDDRAASAVEFALVSGPFFILILYILQIGIYYMTQSALDTGVIAVADSLRNDLNRAKTVALPSAADLKGKVATSAGGLVRNDTTLSVEIRPVTALAAGAVPITDGVADPGTSPSGVLALRAQASVLGLAPGFTNLTQARVTSTALIRLQGR